MTSERITQGDIINILIKDLKAVADSARLQLTSRPNGPLKKIVQQLGLKGKLLEFAREKPGGQLGDTIGVPVKVPGDNGWRMFAGIYIPHQNDRRCFQSAEVVQAVLDEKTGTLFESSEGSRLPFKGGIVVVGKGMLSYWQQNEVVNLPRGPLVGRDGEVRKRINNSGQRMMQKEYLPVLVKICGVLTNRGVNPNDVFSTRIGGLDSVFRLLGDTPLVVFNNVIATGHSEEVRGWVLDRDEKTCQFPGDLPNFPAGGGFTIHELIEFEELSSLRSPRDKRRSQMGVDIPVREDEWGSGEEKGWFCGADRKGRFNPVSSALKSLAPDKGYVELHHIVPRGAAFHALLTLTLLEKGKNPSVRQDAEQLIFALRGLRIRDLVSAKYNNLYTRSAVDVIDNLLKNILLFDRAVNSPFNLITLCPDCHGLAHPDMTGHFPKAITGFLELVGLGLLKDQLGKVSGRRRLVEMLFKGDDAFLRRKVEYGERFDRLHIARALVDLGRLPYWWGPMTDPALDYARVATWGKVADGYQGRRLSRNQIFYDRGCLSESDRHELLDSLPHVNRDLKRYNELVDTLERVKRLSEK